MHSTNFILLLLAIAAAGCSRSPQPEPRVCTQIGCDSGIEIRLENPPAGAFRVEASAPGEPTPRVVECSAELNWRDPEACTS